MRLTGYRFNLDFINTASLAHEIQSHALRMLCHTFSQLVEQLRGTGSTVICVLEGVSKLASSAVPAQWREEFANVLLILNRLATNASLRFKILCTTPFASVDRLVEQRLDVHYSLRPYPAAVYDESAFLHRSLPDRRLDYYRAQMQRNWEDEMDDSDSDDEEEEEDGLQYAHARNDEHVYRSVAGL